MSSFRTLSRGSLKFLSDKNICQVSSSREMRKEEEEMPILKPSRSSEFYVEEDIEQEAMRLLGEPD